MAVCVVHIMLPLHCRLLSVPSFHSIPGSFSLLSLSTTCTDTFNCITSYCAERINSRSLSAALLYQAIRELSHNASATSHPSIYTCKHWLHTDGWSCALCTHIVSVYVCSRERERERHATKESRQFERAAMRRVERVADGSCRSHSVCLCSRGSAPEK